MTIQIKSTATVGNDGVKTLVYGPAGSGKTPLCATAPNPIILSAESGLLSLRQCNPPVPYIEIRSMRDLMEAYNWCLQAQEARQFYTICLDSISEVMEVVLDDEKKKSKDPRKAYGELLEQGMKLTRAFRDLPGKCVVVVAKQQYDKDETLGAMMYAPMLPGSKLGPQLPYFFDEVFQMCIGRDANQQVIRYIRAEPEFNIVARDRSGRLAKYEPPNLTFIFNKILGIA
jgi:hypothetical protein